VVSGTSVTDRVTNDEPPEVIPRLQVAEETSHSAMRLKQRPEPERKSSRKVELQEGALHMCKCWHIIATRCELRKTFSVDVLDAVTLEERAFKAFWLQ
jgi:hypothetical protein